MEAIAGAGYTVTMPAVETLFAQALELPEDERGELAERLLGTLDPGGDELTGDAWEAAWASEIDQRVREIRSGRVALVDGADVMAEIRALADRP